MRARSEDTAPFWLVIIDVVMINLSMGLAYLLRYRLQLFLDVVYDAPFAAYLPFSLIFSVAIPFILVLTKGYSGWRVRSWSDHLYKVAGSVGITLVIALAWAFVVRPLIYSRLLLLESGFFMIVLISLGRAVVLLIRSQLRRRGIGVRRLVIAGAGEVGRRVMRTIVARPDLGYFIVGYVDDNPDKGQGKVGRFQGLGSIDDLPAIIDSENVDEVIITLPWNYHRRILSILRECARRDLTARLVPDLFQMTLSRVEVSDLGGVPLVEIQEIEFSPAELTAKRAIDLVGSLVALLFGWPLLAIIALAIRLDSPGPVLFRQIRSGKNNQPFGMYKFRTMRVGAEQELENLRDQNEAEGPIFKMRRDPRVTRVGQVLRKWSMDEIPQVFNVLRGEMSLVGPRPPIPSEVDEYQPWHKSRLAVPPGMTGLWQVSGRSELTFDEMVLLDLYYIEHWSPWLDFRILLRTIPAALSGEGAY